ncbi:hypothetical protein CCR75_003309 [Bremia lactucae]|uniref:Peroxin-7 n=1 Tax=Bremia lactucae TaxID=4779 RepID=A0A976ILM2_BRELC|nr:hypothetical protein CCR75_003309 [Bremia lactucae]
MASAFVSSAQIDAVAACSTLHASSGETTHKSLLAVAQSHLEGNLWSGGVALFDVVSSERLCELQLESGVASLAWCSSEGNVIALGCDDGDVRLASLSTDSTLSFVPFGASSNDDAKITGWGHDDVVTGVSVSQIDKNQLATSSWDLTVKLWDITTMDQTIATFDGHTDLIWGVAMNPTHAPVLCSASQDSTVQVWDARHPQSAALMVSTLLPALSVDWHPKQATIFSVGLEDGGVYIFDVRSPRMPLVRRKPHRAAVHVVKYSPYHNDLLATGGDDGKAFVIFNSCAIDHKEGFGVRELRGKDDDSFAHRDYVRALEWFQNESLSPNSDEAILFTGAWDKTIREWNIDSLATLH